MTGLYKYLRKSKLISPTLILPKHLTELFIRNCCLWCWWFGVKLDLILFNWSRPKTSGFISDILTVTTVVPQGSVLGSILFIVYINNLFKISTKSKNLVTFKLFANEAKVYTYVSNIQSAELVQVCLNDISNRAVKWQLQLTHSECSVLQLGKMYVNNSYAVNGVILPLVKNMSNLGITVDYNLDFKLHTSNSCVKAKQWASYNSWMFLYPR